MTGPLAPPDERLLRDLDEQIAAMLADPDLTGDLLLVAIAIARAVAYADDDALEPAALAHQLFGSRADDARVRDALRSDIRRYEPPGPTQWGPNSICHKPTTRHLGVCGHPTDQGALLTDPHTGVQTWKAACGRHRDWVTRLAKDNSAQLRDQPVPDPPANAGGGLARHVPELDWPSIWRQLQPDWTPPPEPGPVQRPSLRLVVNPDAEPRHPGPRPPLAVLPGG